MSGCPFCGYAGPSRIEADYGDVFVVEPIDPVTVGHVLAIPRRHVEDALEDPALTGEVMRVAAVYARYGLSARACNLITSVGPEATQSVRHLHVHVVPRREGDGLRLPWS